MDRDFYQIDAMCSGSFPQYKIKEFYLNALWPI
jgi:hypothetical protein